MRLLAPACFVLALAGAARAELRLENIEAAHGELGPRRESLNFTPLDELVFRFVATGVKTDSTGRCDAELSFRLTNAEGRAVVEGKGPVQRPLMLGGRELPSHVKIAVGPNARPGEYTLTVALRDKLSGETASFERKLTCEAAGFRILSPRFYHDPEGKVPAGTRGLVGESLYFRLRAVGFDRSQKKVHTVMTVRLLDEAGAEVLPQPMRVVAELTRPEDVERAVQLNFNGAIGLNRAGKYRLHVTVEDQLGKGKAEFETPLKVEMP